MKISIIIPVYNCEQYLSRCIESVLIQTLTDFELILINDGSTDNSGEICDEYKSKDQRIIVIHQSNKGVGCARNKGIEISSGEYIYFCDADDWTEENLLEDNYNYAKTKDYDIIIFGYLRDYVNNTLELIRRESCSMSITNMNTRDKFNNNFLTLMQKGNAFVLWSKLYKTSFIKDNKIKFNHYKKLEDGLFNLKLYNLRPKVFVNDKCYYHYIKYSDAETASGIYVEDFASIVFDIYEHELEFLNGFTEKKLLLQEFNMHLLCNLYALLIENTFHNNCELREIDKYKLIKKNISNKYVNDAIFNLGKEIKNRDILLKILSIMVRFRLTWGIYLFGRALKVSKKLMFLRRSK
jgi:glycosyltransferase involved in cell wall biosynthesis